VSLRPLNADGTVTNPTSYTAAQTAQVTMEDRQGDNLRISLGQTLAPTGNRDLTSIATLVAPNMPARY
jgi:hypothetical protein